MAANAVQGAKEHGVYAYIKHFALNDQEYNRDTTSATSVQAMRTSAKHILYTTVNSRAYEAENLNPGTPGWQLAAYGIDAVLAVAVIALEIVIFKKYKQQLKDN